MLSAHQDWSGLVTPDSPAAPGEILHTYAVGFGPTTPAVPFGDAAPVEEPFARVASPLSCVDYSTHRTPVDVLFQGLAPTFAGLYQFDWRVPAAAAGGTFGVYCTSALGGPAVGFIPVRRTNDLP